MALKENIKANLKLVAILTLEVVGLILLIVGFSCDNLAYVIRLDYNLNNLTMGLWQVKGFFYAQSSIESEWSKKGGWVEASRVLMGMCWSLDIVVVVITVVIVLRNMKHWLLVVVNSAVAIVAFTLGIAGVSTFVSRSRALLDLVVNSRFKYDFKTEWGYALFMAGEILFFVCAVLSVVIMTIDLYRARGVTTDNSRAKPKNDDEEILDPGTSTPEQAAPTSDDAKEAIKTLRVFLAGQTISTEKRLGLIAFLQQYEDYVKEISKSGGKA